MKLLRFVALGALVLTAAPSTVAQGLPSGSPIKPAPGWQPPDPPEPIRTLPAPVKPSVRARDAQPGQDIFYDRANPAYEQLQKANQSMAGLPLDRAGYVDWMRLINEGRIRPRAGLAASAAQEVLDLDVVLKNTRQMPWVRFPHRSHTLWLDCANCHPAPFERKVGAARISMESIFRGQWCGVCHDRVAFITHNACDRCHSVPNPTVVKAD